jgi:hypothetical protein
MPLFRANFKSNSQRLGRYSGHPNTTGAAPPSVRGTRISRPIRINKYKRAARGKQR